MSSPSSSSAVAVAVEGSYLGDSRVATTAFSDSAFPSSEPGPPNGASTSAPVGVSGCSLADADLTNALRGRKKEKI
jgi:hypothetical protein